MIDATLKQPRLSEELCDHHCPTLRWKVMKHNWNAIGLFLILFFAGQVAVAQEEGPLAAESDLEQFATQQLRSFSSEFKMLQRGQKAATEQDAELIGKAARYYVYYNTLKNRQEEPMALYKRRVEFERDMDSYVLGRDAKDKNAAFRKIYAQELVKCFQKVMERDFMNHRISQVNTGLMFPIVAKLGEKSAGDFFVDLVKNSKHDVPRLLAIKALQVQFETEPLKFSQFAENKERKEQSERVTAILDYVLNSPKGIENAPIEEQNGFRYVRGEAIKALGNAGVPAYALLDKARQGFDGEILTPVAYGLLKVLAKEKDTLNPPPSFAEKFEAAVALCQLRGEDFERYNANLAVKAVGDFLIELSQAYRKDREAFTASAKVKLPPRYQWKIMAERMRLALQEFSGKVPPGSPTSKAIRDIAKATNTMLDRMKRHDTIEDPTELRAILRALPPPQPEVYKGAKYTVNLS